MEGPLIHILAPVCVFAFVLFLVVAPVLKWLSRAIFDTDFVLRLGRGDPGPRTDAYRRDVIFSIVAVLISLGISFAILQTLVFEGILSPFM